MTEPTFDLEKIYDEQIAPLMAQIIAVCKKHRLPMLASFCYSSKDESEQFATTCLPRGEDEWLPETLEVARRFIRSEPPYMAMQIPCKSMTWNPKTESVENPATQ